MLITSVVLALIAGLVVTLLMTPKYTATSTIEIQRESDRVVNVQGIEPESSPTDLEFYQTQYGLLRSETLAQRVATELRFHENAALFDMFGNDEMAAEITQFPRGANASDRNERIVAAGKILLENVRIEPVRMSRLVEVRFTSADSALSAQIVNAWTRLFIETTLGRRFEATSYAREFLEERLIQLRERLQDSERMLVQYAVNQRIINIPSTTQGLGPVERPLIAENLAALNTELNAATADRMAAQSRLQSGGDLTNEALTNQTISDLRTRRANLSADRAKVLAQFEPDYPPAQALADQIADVDRALAREETRIRGTLQTTYNAASVRESFLRNRVQGLESELMDLRRRQIQYNIHQREVDTNRQLYDALLQRYKEIGVAGGVGINNISVVDPALAPEEPSSPNLIVNLLIAGLLGAGIGVGLMLLLDQADDAISDPRELESKLGLPLLGTIPKSDEGDPLIDLQDPKSPLVEAYLSVHTRLAFTTDHGIPRSLTVTSTRPGEGKSTTVYAIARTLARSARKILLIDGDMRSPSQHTMFGLKNERGLSNFLSGTDDLSSLIHTDAATGLAVMTAGPTPPNAAELLTSDRLATLFTELASRYDHVIVDAPPMMGLADTLLLTSHVEGCIFVIESHATGAAMVQVAIDRLHSSAARVLGGLLTKFDTKRAEYGYGYDYGYGYGESDPKAA